MHARWSHSSTGLAAELRVWGNSGRRLAKPTPAWGLWNRSTPPWKNVDILYGNGPDLCSPFILQSSKDLVFHGCWKSVQRWSSYHWTRHLLTEPGLWYPHPQGFPDHRQHWIGKWVRMTLNVASLNMRGLRDPSKCARLLGELSNLWVMLLQYKRLTSLAQRTVRYWRTNLWSFQHLAAAAVLDLSTSWTQPDNLVFVDYGGWLAGCGWCCHLKVRVLGGCGLCAQ